MNRKIRILIWFGHWVSSWIDIICASFSAITFCYYRPWWDFAFRIYWDKKILRMKIEYDNNKKNMGEKHE